MCGIAGIVGEGGGRDVVARMTERMRMRGPDDGDVWAGPGAALGHRRLSILDLSPAGRQPMTSGDLTIVFNGEIYNYRELRRDLPGPFRSNSDTEVILHLFAREGEGCVAKLRGMFAFAIWDSRRRVLFAARDRLGIKPFLYAERPGAFAFASEIGALLEVAPRDLDRTALADYFTYKYVPAPKTIYSTIRKLPPAHTLAYDGRVRLSRYWSPDPAVTRSDPDAALEELRPLLRECVVSHTLADVPVGVFLSGGIDSTAIVAHLDRPRTFTVGFDVGEHSEAPQARRVAEHFRTEHREETVAAIEVEEALDAVPRMVGEPFGDSSAWPTHIVSRVARRDVKVALSGEGGDEVFSGYGWYRKWLEMRPQRAARALAGVLPPFSSAGRSLHRRGADDFERYAALLGVFTVRQKRALLAPEFIDRDYDPLWHFRAHWRGDLDPVKRMQWADMHTFLPDDILVKADRASMAVSLEVRPPFLDHRLVEFALSLDSKLVREGGEGKRILRRLLRGVAPPEAFARPKKGFSMPVRRWIRERPAILRDAFGRLASAGVLRTSRPPRLDGEQMWTILVLDRWWHRA
ncbi:MAG: asparagine synthase (glutamine-hydrolyzing) [Planctomycetes bacterium]|nr:asparagine synthase (glutamine-hydrolyzing) [Planctomycetota bacterium]